MFSIFYCIENRKKTIKITSNFASLNNGKTAWKWLKMEDSHTIFIIHDVKMMLKIEPANFITPVRNIVDITVELC